MLDSPRMTEYESKQRTQCIWVTLAVIVVVATVAIILGVTFFKARDPAVQVNAISLEDFHIGATSLNISLLLDLTVYNPNRASFKYTDSLTMLYYYGEQIGEAPIPAGNIDSQGTDYLSVLLTVGADRVLVNSNLPSDIANGILPLLATTRLSGIVRVLKVFKHHAVTTSDCDISIFVANATMQSFSCTHSVRL